MGLLDIFDTEQGRLGLAMLAAAGPQARPVGFGERMMGALGTVDQMRQQKEAKAIAEQDRALRRQLIDSQIAETSAQAEERRAKALRDAAALKREQDFLGALAPRREPAAPGQIGSGSFGVVDTGGLPDMPAEMPRNWSALAIQFPDKIDTLEKLARANTFGASKVARTIKGMGPDGKEYEYQVDEFGKPVGQGFAQFRAPIQVNQGDRTTFADPYTLQPRGSMPMNMSPAERDASARGWASNRLAQQRLDFDRSPAGKAPTGYRWSADGTRLEAIQGGPADKDAAATEGERKAATLLTRIEASQATIDDITKNNPGASTPSWASFLPGETIRNIANPENRQRIEAAQLDFLDAALTLGTGAAYTREQLEGYRRSYFPQIGDSQKTIQDKMERQQQLIQAARLSAGRAKSAFAPSGAPPVGTVQNGYRFKGGNPADPSSWEMAR